jgi:hypothetical protein
MLLIYSIVGNGEHFLQRRQSCLYLQEDKLLSVANYFQWYLFELRSYCNKRQSHNLFLMIH